MNASPVKLGCASKSHRACVTRAAIELNLGINFSEVKAKESHMFMMAFCGWYYLSPSSRHLGQDS